MEKLISILLKLRATFPAPPESAHFVTLGGIQGLEGRESTIIFHIWVSPSRMVIVYLPYHDRQLTPESEWEKLILTRINEQLK